MTLKLFYSVPFSTFDFGTYLSQVNAILPWIKWTECEWPQVPHFERGINNDLTEGKKDHFAKWAQANLEVPALVFMNRALLPRGHSFGALGMAFKNFPVSLVTTSFKSGTVSLDVCRLVALHELVHMGRNTVGALSEAEVDQHEHHCLSQSCVLNLAAGNNTQEVEMAVLKRGNMLCKHCALALDKVKDSGVWS